MTENHTNCVTALIVTYNRSKLLQRCLEALRNQTYPVSKILVVNNASTDDTLPRLQSEFPEAEVLNLSQNTGGAGGFSAGLSHLASKEQDFIWLMDDDAWAEPTALEELVLGTMAITPAPSFSCSRVLSPEDDAVNLPHPLLDPSSACAWDAYLTQGMLPLKACSFVSVLIPTQAVRQYGVPFAHYFLWFDDHEYTLRLSQEKAGWYISKSVVRHARPGGLRIPDIEKETSESRFPLYRHYFANLIETRARHPRHFQHIVLFYRNLASILWRLAKGKKLAQFRIAVQGMAKGILRSRNIPEK